MSTKARGVMLVCEDCKRSMRGRAEHVFSKSCDRCGGQLKVRVYGPPRKRSGHNG